MLGQILKAARRYPEGSNTSKSVSQPQQEIDASKSGCLFQHWLHLASFHSQRYPIPAAVTFLSDPANHAELRKCYGHICTQQCTDTVQTTSLEWMAALSGSVHRGRVTLTAQSTDIKFLTTKQSTVKQLTVKQLSERYRLYTGHPSLKLSRVTNTDQGGVHLHQSSQKITIHTASK